MYYFVSYDQTLGFQTLEPDLSYMEHCLMKFFIDSPKRDFKERILRWVGREP
jgi:hypothetical protein